MKRFTLLIIALIAAISFAVIAATTKDKEVDDAKAKPDTVAAAKQRMLTNIDKQSHILDQYKSCVNGSQNVDALRSCAQTHKLAEKQLDGQKKKSQKAAAPTKQTSKPTPTSKP